MRLLLMVGLTMCWAGGETPAHTSNFDDAVAGTTPAGWTATKTGSGEPNWKVEKDPTAPSAPNVLKQSGVAAFPICINEGALLVDGFVQVTFKAVSGKKDQAAGVIWRCTDADNYYVVRANALEDNVVLYKTVNGKRTSLEIIGRKGGYGVDAEVAPGQWHLLRVEFAGNRFKVIFNANVLFEVEDTTFAGPGKVGVWTKADSLTLFDDFTYGGP